MKHCTFQDKCRQERQTTFSVYSVHTIITIRSVTRSASYKTSLIDKSCR